MAETSLAVAERQITAWLSGDGTSGLYIEDDRELTVLPTIPYLVTHLTIRNCPNLAHIPALPACLKHLQISDCPQLECLPSHIPPYLHYLDIQTKTNISVLPLSMANLETLILHDAVCLHHITCLPSTLIYIDIRNAPLQTLCTHLPPNLLTLIVRNSHLRYIPLLPDTLQVLEISSPFLESTLMSFPNSLAVIKLASTPITTLPPLPTQLIELNVGDTKLSNLPPLPGTLQRLYIDATAITNLPDSMPPLSILSCAFTNICNIPRFHTDMDMLNVAFTPIKYLRADEFEQNRIQIYHMKTHAYSLDRFPKTIKHIHFSNPDFMISDLPPLPPSDTITISFEYDGKYINSRNRADFEHVQICEMKKQMDRVAARVRSYKEELMVRTWHPSRIEDWCGVRFDTIDDI
jgi:hypothetical protein